MKIRKILITLAFLLSAQVAWAGVDNYHTTDGTCSGFDSCDNAAFLAAIGGGPTDVHLEFDVDKDGGAINSATENIEGNVYSYDVILSSSGSSLVVHAGSGSSYEVGPYPEYGGTLILDFVNPVSAVGMGAVEIYLSATIRLYNGVSLIATTSGASNNVFDYLGFVATGGDVITRIEIDGDFFAIQDLSFNFADAQGPGSATFNVTKVFSDGSDDEVDVTLTCNSGLPLKQDFTIAGGDLKGVTFVVTELPDSGANCKVTESGGPSGYTALLNGSADGCTWSGVTGGSRTCAITNTPDMAKYTIKKVWDFGADEDFDRNATVDWTCENVALDSGFNFGTYTGDIGLTGNDQASIDFYADPEGGSRCKAEETVYDSAVESDQGCASWTPFGVGDEKSCTITNTVFFEGIPTLSQYGLALMALLMLGVGFVGFRRFV